MQTVRLGALDSTPEFGEELPRARVFCAACENRTEAKWSSKRCPFVAIRNLATIGPVSCWFAGLLHPLSDVWFAEYSLFLYYKEDYMPSSRFLNKLLLGIIVVR